MKDHRSREWVKGRSAEVRRVMREIVEHRCPDHSLLLTETTRKLTIDERDAIISALADELMAKGLEQTDEPTAYGLIIEDAIDLVGTM